MFGFFTYSKRLNDLFADAVNIWVTFGYKDALEIACGAAATAAGKQRDSMIYYVSTADELIIQIEFEDELQNLFPDEKFDLSLIQERKNELLRMIGKLSNVSLMDVRRAMSPKNEKAVQKADTSFFRLRYPSFPLWDDVS